MRTLALTALRISAIVLAVGIVWVAARGGLPQAPAAAPRTPASAVVTAHIEVPERPAARAAVLERCANAEASGEARCLDITLVATAAEKDGGWEWAVYRVAFENDMGPGTLFFKVKIASGEVIELK